MQGEIEIEIIHSLIFLIALPQILQDITEV